MSETDPQHLQPADNLEYVNYLKSIEDKWPEYTRFRKFLEDNSKGILPYQRPGFTGSVILCDVLSDSSRQSSIIFEAGKIASIHSLEHFLSNPPKGLRSRIIILDLKNTGKTIDQRVLNLLRLKFNVEPLFYGVLFRFCELSRPRLSDVLNMGYINFKEFQNSTSASYTDFIGKASIRISSSRILISHSAIIAINQGSAPLEDVLYIEYCSALFSNLHDGHSISDNENFCDFRGVELTHFGRIKLFQVFAKLLQAQQTTSSEQDKFDYLVSIAKLHSAVCHQNISNFTRRQGDESDWNNLAIFSRNVCQFRRDIRTFAFYAKQKFGGAAYQTQLEYIRSHQEDLLAEVQELESCLRNELQFNVSLSSLKESRLSIEEGKRIRLSKLAARRVLVIATSFS